nr:hypothetical protein [Bacteroidota bacterium]
MNNNEQNSKQRQRLQRPQLLIVLCILSFIGSGISGITFFTIYSSYEEIIPMLIQIGENFPGMGMFSTAGKNFYLTGSVLYLFSFVGINLIWRMKKVGFHFYAGSQIMLLILPFVYIQGYPIPIVDGLITALFIGLYTTFYKILN